MADDQPVPPAKSSERFVPVWKFPQAKALGEALVGNLTENMINPDALEAKRDAQDLARAKPVDPTNEAAATPKE